MSRTKHHIDKMAWNFIVTRVSSIVFQLWVKCCEWNGSCWSVTRTLQDVMRGVHIFSDIHYIDVIMTTMASQITSLTVVYSTVYSDADQRKHQSSASLPFVWGIHRDRWIPRTKGQLRGKCFHLMTSSCSDGHSRGVLSVTCCTIWSCTPIQCEVHGPSDSVEKKTSAKAEVLVVTEARSTKIHLSVNKAREINQWTCNNRIWLVEVLLLLRPERWILVP